MILVENQDATPPILHDIGRESGHTTPPILPDVVRHPGHNATYFA